MAKASSHLMNVIRGSVGGLNYTANQFAQIVMRIKTNPVNPSTDYQNYVRNGFSYSSGLWKNTLTDAQRRAWHQYAQTVEYESPTGNYFLPGRQMFIAIHTLMKYMTIQGEVFTFSDYSAPIITGNLAIVVEPSAAPAAASTTGFDVEVSNPGTEIIKVYAEISIPFLDQRNRYKGPYLPETFQTIELAASASDDLVFAGLVEDMIYFVKVRGITKQTPHRISPITHQRCLSIATGP